MKTWLKGGLIGFIIGIIFAGLFTKIPITIIAPPGFGFGFSGIILEMLVKYIIPFTILGVAIGWLVNKFRK